MRLMKRLFAATLVVVTLATSGPRQAQAGLVLDAATAIALEEAIHGYGTSKGRLASAVVADFLWKHKILGATVIIGAAAIYVHSHPDLAENRDAFLSELGILHNSKAGPADLGTDAKAPGKPSEDDGFVPPKNWDGQKVRNPNGKGSGFPDKDGNVWVPTGPGPLAHGGPHWDVQKPDGSHENVYPGGRVR